uniref:Tannase/feruloyl esterase family alpha/beta hydrolase n=1 Tax=Macrostomum lignano TaxID=282301 RepID=A0A1I8GML6_9PLAT
TLSSASERLLSLFFSCSPLPMPLCQAAVLSTTPTKLAVFADPPTRTPAATRLDDCAAFAFSAADGACGIGYRLNWTAGSGGWLGQTADSAASTTTVAGAGATTVGATTVGATTGAATPAPTTAPKAPYLAFWGGGGGLSTARRTQCQSMGYADLVSYDNRMGGSSMPNEFNITADLFKSYTDFSVYLIGARYKHQRLQVPVGQRRGQPDPQPVRLASAANTSVHCVTVDRTPPYSMRSVDCATPVEAVICELV